MAFAVVKTGGKQYRVNEGDTLSVEKLDANVGDEVVLDDVLLHVDGDTVTVGTPTVKGKKITATVLEQGRDKKKIVFKFKNKTRQGTKNTHRQPFTKLSIKKIG